MRRTLPFLALLACASPPPRPPVPDVAGEIERLRVIPRVHRAVARLEVLEGVQAAQNAVLRARSPRDRREAMRGINLVARRAP